MKRKKGFTLAEVLITLSIIGVVSAMTLPTLNASVGSARNRAALKKALSTLNGAVRNNEAHNGWNFSSIGTEDGCGYDEGRDQRAETDLTMCALLNDSLAGETFLGGVEYGERPTNAKYFFGQNVTYNNIGGSAAWFVAYRLSDGAVVALNRHPRNCNSENYLNDANGDYMKTCIGFIDVNGAQGPNQPIECSNGTTRMRWDRNYTTCDVEQNTNADMFPVLFYDSNVELGSNAALAYFNAR